VDDERKVGGRSLQTLSPETAKVCDPYIIVIVLSTNRSPHAAQQRQRRPVLAAAGTYISVRQDGAAPCILDTCRQWYTACTLFAHSLTHSLLITFLCELNNFCMV